MALAIIKALATWSECYKAGKTISPSGIVVHSTGANNPNLKRYVNSPDQLGENIYKNYWGTGTLEEQEKSGIPHAAIGKDKSGKVALAQVLPFNMRCWGCGSGKNGSYNASHIQFEICEDNLSDKSYFEAAFDLAARFCVELMQTYPSIKLENIVSHKEACARGYASNHGDPENWLSKFGKDMNWFRDRVKSYGADSATSGTAGAKVKVTYAKLSDLVGTKSASITTVFKEKGSCWSSGWHNGVDIAAAADTPIYAAADGVVVNADTEANSDGFGNRVILKHPDGRATVYAHMVAPAPVKVGQSVKKGQVIGKVGNTGKSYGAHLHLTMLDNYDRNPNIYYSGYLLDPILVCGLGTLKFGSLAKSVIVENGVKKDLGDLNKYYSVISTGTTTVTNTANSAKYEFKIGDIVNFTGTTHYVSSDGTRGTACKPGKAKITIISVGAAHPYHLVNEGGGCSVYGWVNAEHLQSAAKKSVDEIALEVIRGDWGNGDERKQKIVASGYDYDTVQTRVSQLMK